MGVERIGIVFAGGPAPAANAVINAAVMAIRRSGREAIGIRNGYQGLQEHGPERPFAEGADWFVFGDDHLRGLRNGRGVLLGTSRAHPGRPVRVLAELDDPTRTAGLQRVHAGLRSIGVSGLVSIGGDGTLRTANLLHAWQLRHVPAEERVRVVHVPKTIDNDYKGIDFTFGFFTAVDTLAKELLNLRADALATSSWFVVECMGRRAGWLGYGAAIAGEAHMVIGVEDVDASLSCEEVVDGERRTFLDLARLVDRIVDLMLVREGKGKGYGTVVVTEGLVERLPPSFVASLPRDGNSLYGFAQLQLGRTVARRVTERYRERTGRERKVTGVQLGYESRCAAPHAFDVILACQLGMGAARGLIDGDRDGVMVSVSGQMDLRYVPFSELIDPATLATEVRYVTPGSDFHRLAHALGTRLPPRA